MKFLFSFLTTLLIFTTSSAFATQTTSDHDHAKLCPVYFASADLCAEILFQKGPTEGDESQFLVKFYEHTSAHGDHVMVDPQNLKIDLWMNMGHHGHGSSPVKIVKQDVGVYFVSEAYFVMSGRWDVRLFANGEQAAFSVDVP